MSAPGAILDFKGKVANGSSFVETSIESRIGSPTMTKEVENSMISNKDK